jgi:hypothetical protein
MLPGSSFRALTTLLLISSHWCAPTVEAQATVSATALLLVAALNLSTTARPGLKLLIATSGFVIAPAIAGLIAPAVIATAAMTPMQPGVVGSGLPVRLLQITSKPETETNLLHVFAVINPRNGSKAWAPCAAHHHHHHHPSRRHLNDDCPDKQNRVQRAIAVPGSTSTTMPITQSK